MTEAQAIAHARRVIFDRGYIWLFENRMVPRVASNPEHAADAAAYNALADRHGWQAAPA